MPQQNDQITDIDLVTEWITECTTAGATYTLILHANYARWMEGRNMEPLPLSEFGTALRLLNIDRQRDRRGSLVALALRPAPAKLKAYQQAHSNQREKLRRLFR